MIPKRAGVCRKGLFAHLARRADVWQGLGAGASTLQMDQPRPRGRRVARMAAQRAASGANHMAVAILDTNIDLHGHAGFACHAAPRARLVQQ